MHDHLCRFITIGMTKKLCSRAQDKLMTQEAWYSCPRLGKILVALKGGWSSAELQLDFAEIHYIVAWHTSAVPPCILYSNIPVVCLECTTFRNRKIFCVRSCFLL